MTIRFPTLRTAFAVTSFAVLGIAATLSPANAQVVCAERAHVLEHLGKKFSESPVAMGMAANGGVMEVLSTDDGNTWTVVITMPDGKTCMLLSGENWEALPHLPASLGPKV